MDTIIQNVGISAANWLLSYLLLSTPAAYGVLGFVLTTGAMTGRRLAYLRVPERPLLSPVLRHVGVVAAFMSKITLAAILTTCFLVVSLAAIADRLGILWQIVSVSLTWTALGVIGGVGFSLGMIYRWIPIWERGRGLDDVVKLASRLQKLSESFDPEDYIRLQNGAFLGRDDQRRPIYIPHDTLQKNHVQLVGVSGTGKSAIAGLILAQCAMNGEAVVVLDPKSDEFLPGALARIAAKHGIRFHCVDLRPEAAPQLNPFQDCAPWQVEEMLVAAFELGKSGDAAVDYHRGEDRDAVLEISKLFAEGAMTISKLFRASSNISTITDRTNFWREFRHLCSLPVFHAKAGLNLAEAISNGDIIYIIGSTTADRVYAGQRLILQRILQIIGERPRTGARPVALMLDELKYVLSVPTLRAMGTIRDRNCHLVVAHQSINDLNDCGGLDPKAVRGAVHGNTAIKVAYRINEFESAREFEGLGGSERTFVENINTRDDTRSNGWREAERPRIRADVLTHLPKPCRGDASVGILYGLGPARLISTRFLQSGPVPKVVPAEADTDATKTISVEELV